MVYVFATKMHLICPLNVYVFLFLFSFNFDNINNTIFISRYFRYILSPFGKTLGIKSTRTKRATPNPILESAYNECSKLRHKTVSENLICI